VRLLHRNDQPEVAEVAKSSGSRSNRNCGIDFPAHPMQWSAFLNERQEKNWRIGS